MAEKEYIELGKVIDLLEWDNDIEKWVMSDGGFLMLLPADVVEVTHSTWDENEYPFCNVCMECGLVIDRTCIKYNSGKLNQCPNCGAKMDGGKTE